MLIALLLACSDEHSSGIGEPVSLRDGVFHDGAMPVDSSTVEVIYAAGVGYVVTQGTGNLGYSGLVSADSYGVGVQFPTLSTGYWVVAADGPDVTQDNNLLFDMTLDFTREIPYGLQELQFAAIDENGDGGPVYSSQLCVLPEQANGNFAACDAATTPQNAILSLFWDTNVDLDLIVVAPNGKVVSSKNPTTAIAESGAIPSDVINDPTTGTLSRDSNVNCHIDGIRRESLVFPGEPPAGDYAIYASLNSSCGESYVNYGFSLFQRVDADDGTHPVERTDLGGGELIEAQADGGETLGTYVTTVTLP